MLTSAKNFRQFQTLVVDKDDKDDHDDIAALPLALFQNQLVPRWMSGMVLMTDIYRSGQGKSYLRLSS